MIIEEQARNQRMNYRCSTAHMQQIYDIIYMLGVNNPDQTISQTDVIAEAVHRFHKSLKSKQQLTIGLS